MLDSLGDRMKLYEQPTTTRRAFKGQPIVARLDGKAFHTFCRGLARPYDQRLCDLMQATMVDLVEHYQAAVGYTQSDEITLAWYVAADDVGDYPFAGRLQKIESLMAARATAIFGRLLPQHLPEKAQAVALFDCRAFVVPSLTEAYNAILWRQQDATKNAISMAAQSMFSHKQLQGKSCAEMQEMMFAGHGVNFNDYPPRFKRGVFARRVREERTLTPEQLARIPEQHRPTGPVTRSFVDTLDIWLGKDRAGVEALFDLASPPNKEQP